MKADLEKDPTFGWIIGSNDRGRSLRTGNARTSHFLSRPAASFGVRPAPSPTASAAIYTVVRQMGAPAPKDFFAHDVSTSVLDGRLPRTKADRRGNLRKPRKPLYDPLKKAK